MSLKKSPLSKTLTRSLITSLGIPSIFFAGLMMAALLGWDWQAGLSKLTTAGGYNQTRELFPTSVVVTKVLDGDTIEIDNGQSVRLVGINAPDRGEKGYQEAKNYLIDIIEGEKVRLEYDTYQEDQFGRVLAYVWEACKTSLGCEKGERMVNWVLIKNGYAEFVSYKDRRKLKYDTFLSSAEN